MPAGMSMTHRSVPGAAGVGAVRGARQVSELEGEQPQPIARGEDPQLVLPRGRDGGTGRVEVGASDRNAWLGDTAITNEWGNVGPDEVGRGDAGCEQLFVVGARFGRLVVAMEEGEEASVTVEDLMRESEK